MDIMYFRCWNVIRLIGRVDCQAKRDEDRLTVNKVWLEPKVKWSDARNARLESELMRQSRLAKVGEIDWNDERIIPHPH